MDAAAIDRIRNDWTAELDRYTHSKPLAGFPVLPDIAASRYVDPEFYRLEQQHLWTNTWLLAGHADELPEVGSYKLWREIGQPILLVRGRDRRVRAFYNTCQHRGAPVVRDKRGTARNLRCQYHSWTYDITHGQLIQVPDERDFIDLCRDERGLVQMSCEVWQGWVFVNQDPQAASLHDWFGPALDQLDELAGDTLTTITTRSVIVPCNWKVTAEAFLEVYHFRHIH
ncbi:MAG: aromatic ring-hydroxylating dioxygenase subunit alpha, partial [Steroidobacteraceae bacterium]